MKPNPYLKLTRRGLDVSGAYWQEIGMPAIRAAFPEYEDRIACGLVGEGSECWGFDDRISTDHDYGPSFCIWLTKADKDIIGDRLQAVYEGLPKTFEGYTARVSRDVAGKRTGVFEIGEFYSRFLGSPDGPKTLTEWLATPDSYLSVASNGEVFTDPVGAFSAIRSRLLAFYPEDVRKKKLAAALVRMAHAGQANYPRMMRRGDIVTANTAVSEFIDGAIQVIYLLNRTYMPYYKWRFRGLTTLPLLNSLAEPIEELAGLGSTLAAWMEDDGSFSRYYSAQTQAMNLSDRRVFLMEDIAKTVLNELRSQDLCRTAEVFLEVPAYEIFFSIDDPELKTIHILQG